jgi:hypothetical protein
VNLNDIIQAAQGGQGINNIASQFGLTPEQAQAAVQALLPALSKGLQGATQNPGALGGILSELTSGAHATSYSDPSQTGTAASVGGGVLGQIFGSSQVTQQIGQQASRVSGVDPQIIEQMLPAVASILMGGLAHHMGSQGMGGILGELAGALNGSAATSGQPQATNDASGGMFGGLVGSVLGGLFGGGGAATAGTSSPGLQAGLNSLINVLAPGVQVPQAHDEALNSIMANGQN